MHPQEAVMPRRDPHPVRAPSRFYPRRLGVLERLISRGDDAEYVANSVGVRPVTWRNAAENAGTLA